MNDQFGNAVTGDPVTIGTDGDFGLGAVTDNGDGTYSAPITASTTYGDSTVTAHDGVLSDSKPFHETALPQTITFANPGSHAYGDVAFASLASSDSNLTVTLSSRDAEHL